MIDGTAQWNSLRSDIYIRDKGICWVCNGFVDIKNYDVGHLVDRCNGGLETYDNLVVMHHHCNIKKPRHTNLEEAMRWKLTPKYLTERPTGPTQLRLSPPRSVHKRARLTQRGGASSLVGADAGAMQDLITEYLATNQELLIGGNNPALLRAIRDLSATFGVSRPYIRAMLKRRMSEVEVIKRIVPGTLAWKQGEPFGGPMWKLLPPPYLVSDRFTMRRLPPGALDDQGRGPGSSYRTLQMLGGNVVLDVNINLGWANVHIVSDGTTRPTMEYLEGDKANTVGINQYT